MKGSEKQIKWATEIINNAMETIRKNKENAQNSTAAPIRKTAEVWAYMEARYTEMLKADKMQDAAFVINNRNAEVFQPLKLMSRIDTASHYMDNDLMAAAKKVLG